VDGDGSLARASWRQTPGTEALGSRTTRTGIRGRSVRTYRPARAGADKSRRCSGESAPSARPTISRYVNGRYKRVKYWTAEHSIGFLTVFYRSVGLKIIFLILMF